MHDPLLVRGFEGFRDLLRNGEGFVDRYRTARNALGQVITLDELHHECATALRLFDTVDRSDVWMVQRGEDLGFALKTRQPIGIRRQRRRDDLDGDFALQPRVRRAIDLAHAAGADLRNDFVEAEPSAGCESQSVALIIRTTGRWHREQTPIALDQELPTGFAPEVSTNRDQRERAHAKNPLRL